MSEYSNPNILIFVHIPKTAGTSIHTALRQKFELSLEKVIEHYPNARPKMPKRDKYCINYIYVGHWKNKNGVWPKNLLERHAQNYDGSLAKMARWKPCEKSKTISYYSGNKIIREDLNFVPFIITRCPYKRFISAYNYLNQFSDLNDKWYQDVKKIFLDKDGTEEYKFSNFIEKLNPSINHINNLNIPHLKTMKSFILNENGESLVKEIIKFDSLQEEFDIFLSKYEYEKINLPHKNVTEKNYDYINFLNKNSYYKDIIYNFYKEDFIFFNYNK